MLFKDVMVEEGLKRQLVSMVRNNRISHAQLFLSQAGSHSFALAVAYSQYICCENPGEWDSCGECPSCAKFEKLAHPDLHLIFPNAVGKTVKKDPDSDQFADEFRKFVLDRHYHIDLEEWLTELGGENKQASINIRDCANIIRQNSVRSYEGGYKIFILWNVERLYYAAAPKLLKTLEEPENKTVFILMAENPDRILSTILSRTQLIKIPRLSDDKIKNRLMCDFGAPEDLAADIAEISDGNYNKALSLFEDRGELKEMLHYFDTIFGSMLSLAEKRMEGVLFTEVQSLFSEIVSRGRESQKSFISFMIRIFRNILFMNTDNAVMIKSTSDEKKIIRKYLSSINLKNAAAVLHECNEAIYHIERNGNSGLVFTDLYLKLAQHLAPRP